MIFPNFHWPEFGGFARRTTTLVSRRMIREHSTWLTRMVGRRRQPPRIPVRKVSEGGFAQMLSTSSGRARAERWWDRALDAVED